MGAWLLVLSLALPVHEGHKRHEAHAKPAKRAHAALLERAKAESDADCEKEYETDLANYNEQAAEERGDEPPKTVKWCPNHPEGPQCVTQADFDAAEPPCVAEVAVSEQDSVASTTPDEVHGSTSNNQQDTGEVVVPEGCVDTSAEEVGCAESIGPDGADCENPFKVEFDDIKRVKGIDDGGFDFEGTKVQSSGETNLKIQDVCCASCTTATKKPPEPEGDFTQADFVARLYEALKANVEEEQASPVVHVVEVKPPTQDAGGTKPPAQTTAAVVKAPGTDHNVHSTVTVDGAVQQTANGHQALHGMKYADLRTATLGPEQDFHARYRRAYDAMKLPDKCEGDDAEGALKKCWQAPCADDTVPGLKFDTVYTCMMIHDVISSSLLELREDLRASAAKWRDAITIYLQEVQMKQTEMELRQKESQTIAQLFTMNVIKIKDDGAGGRRKALEDVARIIEHQSGQQFGEVLQHAAWLDNALGTMPNYIQENEIEALRLWEKYKKERRILETQRLKSLDEVRKLIKQIGTTKEMLRSIWAPFSKIEAAIGSVIIDLEQGDEDGPVMPKHPTEFTQTPDRHHEILNDQGVIRPSETDYATGELVCRWPANCPVGSCPLTPDTQAQLEEQMKQGILQRYEFERKIREPDRSTADFICRNTDGYCSRSQQGVGSHDTNPCGHIMPEGFDVLGADTDDTWVPCWMPLVFQGEFDIHIMPRRVELTIQGFNFHGGINCMNLFLIPAIKGTCNSFTRDFSDPMELYKGGSCETAFTQKNREAGLTGDMLNPCNPQLVPETFMAEEYACAKHGPNHKGEDDEGAGCQFFHPDPGVRVANAVQEPHDLRPPQIGTMTATYVIRAENMRIRQNDDGVAEDFVIACLIQPKGPPGGIPPTETGQLIGAFCLKNTDRTRDGNNAVLEPCREGSHPTRRRPTA